MMATGSESSSAAAASHYSANARLIAPYAGVTMVAPPGRAARADHLVLLPRVSYPSPRAHKESQSNFGQLVSTRSPPEASRSAPTPASRRRACGARFTHRRTRPGAVLHRRTPDGPSRDPVGAAVTHRGLQGY